MSKPINKTVKLNEELQKYKDENGNMILIPVVSNLRIVDGEVVCEVDSFQEVTKSTFDESENFNHRREGNGIH